MRAACRSRKGRRGFCREDRPKSQESCRTRGGMMARAIGKRKSSAGRQTTEKNIESILKLEKDDERELSGFHRVSHMVGWFVGTIYFVLFQCVFVLVWIALNTFFPANGHAFDPYPFPLLSTVLA